MDRSIHASLFHRQIVTVAVPWLERDIAAMLQIALGMPQLSAACSNISRASMLTQAN